MDIKIPKQLETIEIEKIKPYNRNARHNEKTVGVLVDVMQVVGFNQPILVDKDFVIIKGHARYKAAFKLGMKKVPYIISDNDEETNRFDRVADNKISELAKWDDNLLLNELGTIDLSILENIPNLPKLDDIVTIQTTYNSNIEKINNKNDIYDDQGNIKNNESQFFQNVKERKEEIKESFIRLQCPHCQEKFDVNKKDILLH